jgi:hypothetical protein
MLDGMECRLMRILPLIAVCLFMSAGFGHAQTYDGNLKGLKLIKPLVEDLDEGARACGVTEELIRDGFMYPVSSSNLQISDTNSDAATFYIQLTTLRMRFGCVSAINIKVYVYQFLKPPFSDDAKLFKVELWSQGSINSSGTNEHARSIKGAIEDITKHFMTAWNLDNKPQ